MINSSSVQSIDISPWEHGLKQYFVGKNIYLKKEFAVAFETLFGSIDKGISSDDK